MTTDLPDPLSVEGQELARILVPNEVILSLVHSARTGGLFANPERLYHHYLIATDRRVIIIKPAFGKGVSSSYYSYHQIRDVKLREWKSVKEDKPSHVRTDTVELVIRGNEEVYEANWQGKRLNLEKKEPDDRIISDFGYLASDRVMVRQAVAVIKQQIAIAHAPAPVRQPVATSIPEQIRQLAELRDAGVLTPQEFEAKKAELLSRM